MNTPDSGDYLLLAYAVSSALLFGYACLLWLEDRTLKREEGDMNPDRAKTSPPTSRRLP